MSNRLQATRAALRAVKPLSLCEYLAETGGIRLLRNERETMGSGDLLAMNADKWHRAVPFRKKLVREDSGHTPDDCCEIAFEAGYFPRHAQRPDISELLDAISEDLASGSVYSHYDSDELERIAISEYYAIEAEAVEQAKAQEAPGRVIPLHSTAVYGLAGDVVFNYEIPFMTKKGRAGISYYAKAFRAGERRHAWHTVFRTEQARADAVHEFLASNMEDMSGER